MYHRIVRRQILTSFAHLNRHDYQPVVASFTPSIQHSFAGNHALGGTRHTQASARQWYERLFRLFPDLRFNLHNIVVAGLPGDTRIAVQFRVELTPPDGGSYFNDVAQFIRLKWGRIVEISLYEDTDKLVHLLQRMSEQGITEASAAPITD
jgi:ketosteroid isomerase-like protein